MGAGCYRPRPSPTPNSDSAALLQNTSTDGPFILKHTHEVQEKTYFLCFTLQNNPPMYLDTGTQLLKYGPIISGGPEQNQATLFHLKSLTGTGEDVNPPEIEDIETHCHSTLDETDTVTIELEQISEADTIKYTKDGVTEFRCHMVPLVTPEVPAKLSQITETTYQIEFKPGGNPQVFTVKEKGGILLSFSVDLEGEQKAYMQIPNESSPENLVLMNTQVPEEDSFVVLPDTKLLPPPNV